MPDLAAAAFAAAGTLAPYSAAEVAWPVCTWLGRFTRLRIGLVASITHVIIGIIRFVLICISVGTFRLILLCIAIGIFRLVLLCISIGFGIAALFTPVFFHTIHLKSIFVIRYGRTDTALQYQDIIKAPPCDGAGEISVRNGISG